MPGVRWVVPIMIAAVAALAARATAGCGSSGTGSCYEAHASPYCSNASCCQTVCASDPFCCQSQWDEICVAEAFQMCLHCGDPDRGSCFSAPHPPACDDAECCQTVCTADPFCCVSQWDSSCKAEATEMCQDAACGDPNAGSCWEVQEGPNCDDATCCNAVCAADSYCCETQWDDVCVLEAIEYCADCGQPSAGSCFEPHATASCDNIDCCQGVCIVDPFCCGTQWDEQCVLEAMQVCLGCGDPGAGSCFVAHPLPGCSGTACCGVVCQVDPFCCQVTWDDACASMAEQACDPIPSVCGDPVAGECFLQHGTPFCDHEGCCNTVCGIDPFCCESSWDATCAQEAIENCQLYCGSTTAGDCLAYHDTPYCNEPTCCDAVCSYDPFCCESMWDLTCVDEAFQICLGCGDPAAGSCYLQHSHPSCDDILCCEAVCSADPYCCLSQWDAACQFAAFEQCLGCGLPEAGSCLGARETPSCDIPECCDGVCQIDVFCCAVAWDAVCVSEALAMCTFPQCYGGCPGDLDANATVDATDLAILLGTWGNAGCGDIDHDGSTDAADLAILLGGWGPCIPE